MSHLINTATKFTILRVLLAPIGVTFLFLDQVPHNVLIAAIIYLSGLVTDMIDGHIARNYNQVTKLGGCLDAMADKLLILMYFVFLQSKGLYPLWLLELVLARMIIVNGARSYLISYKPAVGDTKIGRFQGFFIAFSLVIGLAALCVEAGQLPAFADAFRLREWAYYSMLLGCILSVVVPPKAFADNFKAFMKNH